MWAKLVDKFRLDIRFMYSPTYDKYTSYLAFKIFEIQFSQPQQHPLTA
ncbi:MAG: hypothetical protein J7L38_04685 [Thermoproteales archaeon]|nr:hypothetical protein [Thermoproteales archaeon]